MPKRTITAVQAKEDAVEMYGRGIILHDVMMHIMGKYGFSYSASYALAKEAEAWCLRQGVIKPEDVDRIEGKRI